MSRIKTAGFWLILLSCLMSGEAFAASYTFGSGGFFTPSNPPTCQGGSWSRSGSVFTCTGRVVLAAGDTMTVSTGLFETLGDITVNAVGGFTFAGNTIGTTSKNIALVTDYNTVVATGSNTIYGSVQSGSGNIAWAAGTINGSLQSGSGTITLTGTTVTGTLTSSGANNLTNATITGAANISNTLTTSGTTFSSTLTTSGGTTMTGGSVAGAAQINSTLSTTNTTFASTVTTLGAASFSGGSIASNLQSAGSITTTNGTTVGGTLTSTNGAVTLSGGSVTGLVRSGCCQVTTTNTNLQGGARSDAAGLSITGGTIQGAFYAANNTATFSGVTMTSGTLTGASTATFTNSTLGSSASSVSITTTSGAVNLNNTNAYGDFTAPSYSTIYVNSPSTVIGTCLPNSTPANACTAVAVPVCFTDSFDRSVLGTSDWAVTSRNGDFGVPKIVNNRLRLTDNSGNVATAATLQRLFPADSNYIQLQFKYNAYAGNGADGVAVVFSDASVAPQPGAFGGPLGYGIRGATTGFAGGWLGIGIDEYGNFSNEGGTNSQGFRPDSVAIRGSGSGTTGYRWLQGTPANLSPGVDVSGTTPGPGHTYRITLDSRVSGRTQVSVERNTGSAYSTLISSFDIRSQTGQAAIPSNFYVSFTGSTGGSNNIHELDDVQVCATNIGSVGQQIDHFDFSYASSALTCNPQPITIRACLNPDCSSLYTDPVSVTLSPSNYWSATSPATVSGSTITFSGGSAIAQLRNPTAVDVTLGVSSSTPATKALSVPTCSSSGCKLTYADSGFLLTVPNMTAVKPVTGSIQAVKKSDTTQACIPSFASVNRSISFTSAYTNPSTGTLPVVVNGNNITSTATSMSLSFNSSGVAPLTVRYNDAGQMTLNASYTGSTTNGDAGLSMTGSAIFVSKPYGLCLQTDSTCTVAGVNSNCPVFPGGIRAGDSFPLRIKAVGWEADGEALTATALCTGNIVTPNFQLSQITLTPTLVEPAGGSAGTVTPETYDHVLGNQTTTTTSVSEVGVFSITATPASSYFAQTVSGGSSALIGRFIPAYLGATGSAAVKPSCGTAFTYQGQPFAFNQDPTLTVTGYNRQGAITTNYDRGDFWRLNTPARDPYLSVIDSRTGLNSRLGVQGTATTTVVDAKVGDGFKAYNWSGEQLVYNQPTLPGSDDYPVTAAIRQSFPASALTDQDGACVMGAGACTGYSFDFAGTDIRLGRLRIGNASGSELQGLSLPVVLESWQSTNSFQNEGLDTCTNASVLGALTLDSYTGNLTAGKTTATVTVPSAGVNGNIALSAPGAGNDGSVQAVFNAMPGWLKYPWDGSNYSAARGLATFGIYKGSTPLIYRREIYR